MQIDPYSRYYLNPITEKVKQALTRYTNTTVYFLRLAHETALRSGMSEESSLHFAGNIATTLDAMYQARANSTEINLQDLTALKTLSTEINRDPILNEELFRFTENIIYETLPINAQSIEVSERVLVSMHRALEVERLSESARQKATTQLCRLIEIPSSTTAQLDELIDLGADIVNEEHGNTGTALYRAAGNGRVDLAMHLINRGAEVNKKATIEGGGTPIRNAVSSGNIAMVELLIEAGAKLESGTNNPLVKYAYSNFDMLQFLMTYNKNLFVPDEDGCTILHDAAIFTGFERNEVENLRVINLCLENGFHVDTPDNFQRTPLMRAATNGNTKIITHLLNKGADIFLKDNEDDGPLEHALNDGCVGKLETVKLLVDAGAPVLKKDLDLAKNGGKRMEGYTDENVTQYLTSKYTGV